MYDRKAFKREAKERMRASTPHYMLVLLVYVLLTTGLSYVVSVLGGINDIGTSVVGLFLNLLVALFSMVLGLGLCHYTLNLVREKPTGMGDLFEGFSFAGRSIGLNVLIGVYSFLWMILVCIGFGVLFAAGIALEEVSSVLGIILMVLAYIALLVVIVAILLRYAMAQFALAENPDDGVSAAIRRSVQMMKGNKWKLFVLELSFIGWYLLLGLIAVVVLGAGVLISGVSWLTGGLSMDVFMHGADAYEAVMSLFGDLSIWTIVAEVLCLPLTLWLTAYTQTAFARFYNFVSGYDYHRYMSEGQDEGQAEGQIAAPAAQPAEEPAAESAPASAGEEIVEPAAQPEAPAKEESPNRFYTPAPKLDDSEEDT